MSETTKIQWTEKTWNPFHGCKKVSDGCKFCYMYRDKSRYGQDPTKVVRSKSTFYDPLKWKESALVFTCSWSDWFIDEADEWRDECWQIVKDTPHLTYQILTKRPENIANRLPKDWGDGYKNVWLGVSVENHKNRWRIEYLRNTPAKVRFISFEPLLGYIAKPNLEKIHWAIIGGESGNNFGQYKFRECQSLWIHNLVEECQRQKVSVFIKQLGTHLAKKYALKDKHGGDISEFPTDLQIRQMPKGTTL
jgi:protein gp37